jgi:6-phosphogluconate dehydrogenase
MELGVVGLGRMGRIVVDRCLDAGHDVVAFDIDADAREDAADAGATAVDSLEALADELGDEKRIWLMVPAGDPVDAALAELAPHLAGVERGSPRPTSSPTSTAAPAAARRARNSASP